MKSYLKITVLLLALFGLSGCAELNQFSKNIQKISAPEPITDSLPKICQELRENSARANDHYKKKVLLASGEVRSVTKGSPPRSRYQVSIQAGQVSIFAMTPHKQNIINLSVGKKVSVSGVISSIIHDPVDGCGIILEDSTF